MADNCTIGISSDPAPMVLWHTQPEAPDLQVLDCSIFPDWPSPRDGLEADAGMRKGRVFRWAFGSRPLVRQ
jgi:hypothetical protein